MPNEIEATSQPIPDRLPPRVALGELAHKLGDGLVARKKHVIAGLLGAGSLLMAACSDWHSIPSPRSPVDVGRDIEPTPTIGVPRTQEPVGYMLDRVGDALVDRKLEGNDPLSRTIRFWLDKDRAANRGKTDPDLAMEICSGVARNYRLISKQTSTHPASGPGYLVNLPFELPGESGAGNKCQTKYPIIELEPEFEGMVHVQFRTFNQPPWEEYYGMWTYVPRRGLRGDLSVEFVGPRNVSQAEASKPRSAAEQGNFKP